MTLANAKLASSITFIVLVTVITIVNYDRKTIIVQATEHSNLFQSIVTVVGRSFIRLTFVDFQFEEKGRFPQI
jgi:hypothetical protein